MSQQAAPRCGGPKSYGLPLGRSGSKVIVDAMWRHTVNLFWRAFWAIPSRISGNWTAVVFGVLMFCIAEGILLWRDGVPAMKQRWKENLAIGLV